MIAAYILAACIAAVPAGGTDRVSEPPAYRQTVPAGERALDVFTEIEPAELAETMPEDIRHLAADVIRICEREDVNARFIAAVMRWERRPDLHNFFGWMGSNGKLMRFDSDIDCLERVIPAIRRLYLEPDGRYYHGATVEGVSICYNNTDTWREAIKGTMNYD